MARKTVVELVDDVSGEKATQSISFSVDGVSYEIDLTDANASRLRSDFEAWEKVARRTGGRRRSSTTATQAQESARIRQWAKDNGHSVSERGRISEAVREAYAAAH